MPDFEAQLSTEHPFFRTSFLCVGLFVLELRWKIPECELVGCFRAAPYGCPFSAFPDGVAAFDDAFHLEVVPQDGAHKREDPSERMLPFAVPCHEAQQQVRQQCSPDLPAHGVLVIAEEIRQLKRLLDFI